MGPAGKGVSSTKKQVFLSCLPSPLFGLDTCLPPIMRARSFTARVLSLAAALVVLALTRDPTQAWEPDVAFHADFARRFVTFNGTVSQFAASNDSRRWVNSPHTSLRNADLSPPALAFLVAGVHRSAGVSLDSAIHWAPPVAGAIAVAAVDDPLLLLADPAFRVQCSRFDTDVVVLALVSVLARMRGSPGLVSGLVHAALVCTWRGGFMSHLVILGPTGSVEGTLVHAATSAAVRGVAQAMYGWQLTPAHVGAEASTVGLMLAVAATSEVGAVLPSSFAKAAALTTAAALATAVAIGGDPALGAGMGATHRYAPAWLRGLWGRVAPVGVHEDEPSALVFHPQTILRLCAVLGLHRSPWSLLDAAALTLPFIGRRHVALSGVLLQEPAGRFMATAPERWSLVLRAVHVLVGALTPLRHPSSPRGTGGAPLQHLDRDRVEWMGYLRRSCAREPRLFAAWWSHGHHVVSAGCRALTDNLTLDHAAIARSALALLQPWPAARAYWLSVGADYVTVSCGDRSGSVNDDFVGARPSIRRAALAVYPSAASLEWKEATLRKLCRPAHRGRPELAFRSTNGLFRVFRIP